MFNPFNLANGGLVDPRLGPPGVDTIPAQVAGKPIKLDGEEYVLPADTTAQIGVSNLDALVNATHIPGRKPRAEDDPLGYANGGWIDRAAALGGPVEAPNGPVPRGPERATPYAEAPAALIQRPWLAEMLRGDSGRVNAAVDNRPHGFNGGGFLGRLFTGVPRDRAAQIETAVNGAVAPVQPAPAPAPVPAPDDEVEAASREMMRKFMSDVRAGYADGGQVSPYRAALGEVGDRAVSYARDLSNNRGYIIANGLQYANTGSPNPVDRTINDVVDLGYKAKQAVLGSPLRGVVPTEMRDYMSEMTPSFADGGYVYPFGRR